MSKITFKKLTIYNLHPHWDVQYQSQMKQNEPQHDKTNTMTFAPSEDSN